MLDFVHDAATWPAAARGRIVHSHPHRWHVVEAGEDGPILLLLHGAGASTRSWAGLIPLIAQRARVIAIDLPGHGFTRLGARTRSAMVEMAEDIAKLTAALGATPDALIGHSAGGAIALQLARTVFGDAKIVCFNAALSEFPGLAGVLFPTLAKLMSLNPLTGPIIAGAANRDATRRVLNSTGGPISAEMRAHYHRLISDHRHISGTLTMMSQWRIQPLRDALGEIPNETLFCVGAKDGTVPPEASETASAAMPAARLLSANALGHLAHEQDPDWAAEAIFAHLSL
ncbi:MAG: alpha/beta fold hydrolase BchO [Pseudomonadota bacterium]